MNIFTIVLINPIVNLLVLIYQGLIFVHIPYALGFSIILLTVVFRFALYPLIGSQLKTSQKMQKLTPHLNKLKELHKNDSAKLQAETMKLYQEHGVNPVAGCLPLLVQLPLIWSLYAVLQQVVKTDAKTVLSYVNHALYFPGLKLAHMWDTSFFGLPLGQTPGHIFQVGGILIVLLPLFTGVFQLIQSKMMFTPKEKFQEVEKAAKATHNKALVKEVKKEDDFATAFQSQSLYIFPAMIALFSWTLPLGLSLYWNTFTIFGILQQYQISGVGGLTEWVELAKKRFGK
ncbi:MAG TPA: YidC/Oxa1 family membrane protein insertase [Candidatus Eisenbacteria bacterium]|nr:YidC/Oxa1 family membrane protein insertase [Candidatus Eisenbacteria bacterium]